MTPSVRTLLAGLCAATLLIALAVTSSAQVVLPRTPLPTEHQPRAPIVAPTLPRPAPAQGAFFKEVPSASVSGSAVLTVAQLSLPPGSYQVIAKGVLIDDSQVEMAIACSLHTGRWDPATGDGLDYASLTLPPASRVPVTLVGSFANTTIGDVTLAMSCRASEGAMASIRWVKLSAVAVPSITTR